MRDRSDKEEWRGSEFSDELDFCLNWGVSSIEDRLEFDKDKLKDKKVILLGYEDFCDIVGEGEEFEKICERCLRDMDSGEWDYSFWKDYDLSCLMGEEI